MNRERAKTGSASKNGVHSHVLGKEVYITPIHTRKMRLQPERGEDFPDRRVRKQCSVTPISLSRELLTHDLLFMTFGKHEQPMSRVPTHLDPRQTDRQDDLDTVTSTWHWTEAGLL